MRKTKKIAVCICAIMCVLVMAGMPILIASASGGITVYAENVSTQPGESVEIPIYISKNSGFMGISLTFSYDASAMIPVSASKGALVKSGLFDDSIGTTGNNEFKVVWCGSDEISSDGEICILKFNVSDSASGDYKVKVSYESKNTFDKDYKAVKLNCEDISVNILNNEAPKQTFWQKLVAPFVKLWKWIVSLFSK